MTAVLVGRVGVALGRGAVAYQLFTVSWGVTDRHTRSELVCVLSAVRRLVKLDTRLIDRSAYQEDCRIRQ